MQVGIAQINPRLGDLRSNLDLYEEKVRQGAKQGLDLLLFPELSLTGYFLRDMVPSVALKLSSPEITRLKKLSREVAFVAGLVEESPDYRFYNAAVYFDAGEIVHVHRKVYLPTYGMFDEQRYFARGDRVRAFNARKTRFALLICEDVWHPSTVYLAALDGALAILCPSSSPLRGITEGQAQDDNARYWEMLNRMYAETFGLFMIYGNRVGFEDGVGFWGGSEVVDPFGERLVKARYYEDDFISGEIELETARRKRSMAPLLRDEDLDLTINELMRIRERPDIREKNPKLHGARVKGLKRKKSKLPQFGNRK
ncbi:MAG: nitrilase-related carbon-nitrogen hydrolase [Candidatus Binatia bacterium]